MEIPGRNCTSSSCTTTIWRSPVGRSHKRPHLLHKASIIPLAIARRQFKFQTMASLQLNSYYADYVMARKQHVRSLNPAGVSDCRSAPALRNPSVCPASNVSTIIARSAIIFRTLGVPAGGKPIFWGGDFL